MNTLLRSLVIGLAFSASALTVSASVTSQTQSEQGCLLSSPMDSTSYETSGTRQDGLGLKRTEAFNGLAVVRLASADTSLGARTDASGDGSGFNRISTRVERLGQGIAATPLVQTLAHPEKGQEPQLSMLLLAALGVVTFVARRRRSL